MNVLLAEDVDVTRRLLEETILAMGHTVTAVADGSAAWVAFQGMQPDLVVVDWLMPGMDGLELSRRIRKNGDGRAAFILLQTVRATADDLSEALRAGVDDYITKPVSSPHLRARIAIAQLRIEQRRRHRVAEDALAHAQWRAGIAETSFAMQHELNTPLTTLLGVIDFGLASTSIDDVRYALHEAEEQARRIADVVKRLSTLQNPQSIESLPGVRMLDIHGDGAA